MAAAHSPRLRPRRRRAPARPEVYYVQRIDNTRVRRVADPTEPRQFLSMMLAGALLFGAMLGACWERWAVIRHGYDVEALKKQCETLLESNRELRLEEARLRSPERIDQLARGNLGLTAPEPGQIVHWDDSVPPEGSVLAEATTILTRSPLPRP